MVQEPRPRSTKVISSSLPSNTIVVLSLGYMNGPDGCQANATQFDRKIWGDHLTVKFTSQMLQHGNFASLPNNPPSPLIADTSFATYPKTGQSGNSTAFYKASLVVDVGRSSSVLKPEFMPTSNLQVFCTIYIWCMLSFLVLKMAVCNFFVNIIQA